MPRFHFSTQRQSSVGICIGSSAVQLVEVRPDGSDTRVERVAYQPYAPGNADGRAAALAAALQERRQTPGAIWLAASDLHIHLDWVRLPPMPGREIPGALAWECRKKAPFDLSQAARRQQRLPEPWHMLLAAQPEEIETVAAQLRTAGAEPAGIVASAAALAAVTPPADTPGAAVAILDIGAERSTLLLAIDGTLRYARALSIGGNDFTRAFMQPIYHDGTERQLDQAAAEALKLQLGIPDETCREPLPQDVPAHKIAFLVRPLLEKLLTETQRNFEFFRAQYRGLAIDRLLLCGGGSQMRGLRAFLESGLGVTVGSLDPFVALRLPAHLEADPQFAALAPRLALAASLALHGSALPSFQPRQRGMLAERNLRAWIPLMLCALLALSGGLLLSRTHREIDLLRTELARYQQDADSAAAARQNLTRITAENNRLRAELDRYPAFSFLQPSLPEILTTLTTALPHSMSIDQIELQPDTTTARLQINGLAVGSDYVVFTLLTKVSETLERSRFFNAVTLESTEAVTRQEQQAVRFVLVCDLHLSTLL